jgi:hypothetical protein
MVSEPTLRMAVVVAQAWCAWLVWVLSGHTTWHMRWRWTNGCGQERTFGLIDEDVDLLRWCMWHPGSRLNRIDIDTHTNKLQLFPEAHLERTSRLSVFGSERWATDREVFPRCAWVRTKCGKSFPSVHEWGQNRIKDICWFVRDSCSPRELPGVGKPDLGGLVVNAGTVDWS